MALYWADVIAIVLTIGQYILLVVNSLLGVKRIMSEAQYSMG